MAAALAWTAPQSGPTPSAVTLEQAKRLQDALRRLSQKEAAAALPATPPAAKKGRTEVPPVVLQQIQHVWEFAVHLLIPVFQ